MVVVKPPSVIRDMPDAIFFMDTDIFGSGQLLFVQSVCNDFTDSVVDFPVFQYFFYVEVKFFNYSFRPYTPEFYEIIFLCNHRPIRKE